MTRIFFATDVHGSEVCWKKFINAGKFYQAEVLILGGDITGKALVPIVSIPGKKYKVSFLEQQMTIKEGQLEEIESLIRNRGYYPLVVSEEEYQELCRDQALVKKRFEELVLQTAEKWLEYAEARLKEWGIDCYICPGNDDMFEVDEVFKKGERVKVAEGKVVEINHRWLMVSTGWTNPTPWQTYRECSEEELHVKLENIVQQLDTSLEYAIFNFHAPPYQSGLDEAPELDAMLRPKYAGRSLVPVGSKAVRVIVEKYQPPLGLFGHIHEGKGIKRLGKTLCINPGSSYEQGILLGCLIDLDDTGIKKYLLTSG